MKKILALATTAAFCLVALTGCFGPTPTETATTFLGGIKANDAEAIAATYSEDSFTIIEGDTEDESSAELNTLMQEKLLPKLLEFDYEITNEAIDGGTATVDAKITTYAVGNAFNSAITDYLNQGMALAFSGASEEELMSLGLNLFEDQIMNMEKTYTDTVTINLTKVDGTWTIDTFEEDDEFYNVITGGLLSTADNYESW